MKLLLTTLAFTNPNLLDTCLTSWFNHTPRKVHKGILWQGNHQEMFPVVNKYCNYLDICMSKVNNYYVSGGWNILLLKAFELGYDGVIIVGSDTYFLPKFWDDFVKDLDKYDFVESSHQFNCFYISKKCFDVVGTFDENINAYCEDDDYRIRVIKSEIKYGFGKGDRNLLYHEGSATVRRNPFYQFKSYKSFQLNKEYMFKKWKAVQDSDPKWKPVFETPFNDPKWPLDKWVLDAEGRKKRLWENIIEDRYDKRLVPLLKCLHGTGIYDNNTKEI
jgi:hypothetical protein